MELCSGLKLFVLGALFAVGSAQAAEPTRIKFAFNFALDGSAGPYLLALERGYFKEQGLDVTIDPSSGSGDAVTRVASGTYQMASADFSTLVEFAARQPAVTPKAVFVMYERAPQAIISLSGAGIKKPADLVGKTVGGGNADGPARLFPALMRIADVDPSRITYKQISPQLRDSMLLTGQVDAVLGNDYTSWFNLKGRGAKREGVNILEYADFGLDVYSNSIIASQALLRDKPEAVGKFIAAALKGWRDAMADPAAATKAVAARNKLIDPALETERLQFLIDHKVKTPNVLKYGIGYVDAERMKKNIATITESFELPAEPPVSLVYDPQFAPGGKSAVK